jgi:dihydrofolate synthase/folylpolyglutamate synthase
LKSTKKRAKKRRVNSSPKVSKVKSKKPFKTYKQAISYLFDKTDYEKEERLRYNITTFNLNRMKKMLTLVGNPHKKIATVHIAGTKGKGSTATMIARMLEANGYKVGLYTSPHVLSIHERITINNIMISENDMMDLLNRIYAPLEKFSKTDAPTFFEILTAIAFMYFIDKEVDIAVVETGLGGRLDSTNVIKPEVVGITSLSIDHQAQLGGTLAQIAKEKAGVFKAGVPIVTVEQKPEAMRVLRTEAAALKAPISVTGGDIDFSHLRVPLSGRHQATNCALALAIVDKLKASGYEIDNSKAAKGLDNVSLLGRMEMIYEDPRILIDAAHNADSIEALMLAIGQSVPYDSMVVIFGCNNDKDVEGMLEKLQYGADKVIFTRSSSPKAMPPDQLAEIYTDVCGKMCQSASSLGEALRLANSAIGKEDLICITGSFYLIGQAKQRFKSN